MDDEKERDRGLVHISECLNGLSTLRGHSRVLNDLSPWHVVRSRINEDARVLETEGHPMEGKELRLITESVDLFIREGQWRRL